MIPTRWRTVFEDQVADAEQRVSRAEEVLAAEEGGRALQAAYQAVVAAASVRVWLVDHPWEHQLSTEEMQRRVHGTFPNMFAAIAALDLTSVLTSAWTQEAAAPYVAEARGFVAETRQELRAWLPED